MPLYEYQCDSCGHRFETIVKFSDPPITACPKCGASVRKLVSSPAFQFKGSGWYVTDYAKKSEGATTDKKAEGGESKEAAKDTKETKDAPAKDTGTKDSGGKEDTSKPKTTGKS